MMEHFHDIPGQLQTSPELGRSAEEYRLNAAACRSLAVQAYTDSMQHMLLSMAEQWDALAAVSEQLSAGALIGTNGRSKADGSGTQSADARIATQQRETV